MYYIPVFTVSAAVLFEILERLTNNEANIKSLMEILPVYLFLFNLMQLLVILFEKLLNQICFVLYICMLLSIYINILLSVMFPTLL